MTVSITINDRQVTVPKNATILEAARSAGITIPTLCHHPDLSDVGACRMCVVSVEKARGLQTACTTPVFEGMAVNTESDEARETRKFVLEMLLTDHPNKCMMCNVNGDCELQDLVYDYGVVWPEHKGKRHNYEIDPDPNPFIFINRNKCIACGRCIRACDEIQNRSVWSFAYRGFETKLVAGADQLLLDARCESCGLCVAVCPVGALDNKMSVGQGRASQITKVRTTCAYCGVGCNFDLNVRDGKIIRVTSADDAPVNGMSLCVKGRYGYDYVHHPDRLTRPLIRAKWLSDVEAQVASGKWQATTHKHTGPQNGNGASKTRNPKPETRNPNTFIETDWDTALDLVAAKYAETKKTYGSDAFAVLASAKCTNEENYLFNKFARQVLGTNTIDHCARL
ncbi:MAG TPA: molybdopterin-dependent oxidoreductase [Chloroflexi bacterium]|nr:MAG: hypothetical protein B6243_03210 [Anaerolineaceae bacterium 4572_5.2]HEY86040.1 molybdopterin-dependent oxidoreductase [Chloroflexota bacterium]